MLLRGDHMSTISDAVPLTAQHYVCLVHGPLIRTDALIRGPCLVVCLLAVITLSVVSTVSGCLMTSMQITMTGGFLMC